MRISDIAEFILLAALWGGSFLFMRIASPVLGPVWLIELRVLLAGLVLLPLLIKMNLLGEVRRKLIPLFILGCINSAIPFCLFAFAALSLPAGFTSIINATTPLFGIIVASIWLKEKLTITRSIGFALGFAGVVILIGWKTTAITQSFIMAVVAALLAPILYSIAAAYVKRNLADVPPLVITTTTSLSAAIFLLPAIPFTIPKTSPTAIVILAVIALAIFSTALAYILFFRLIKNIGSTRSLTVAYLVPIFAILWGAIFLKESVTISMVVGCIFIFIGTAIANNLLTSLIKM
jgi:drug/metabolite transporter (DMT)-like permease